MFLELKNNHILFWNNLILFTFWSKIFRRDKVQRLLRKKIETRKNSIRGFFCLKENWKTFLRKLNISQWNLFGWYPLRYKLLLPLNSIHLSIFLSIMHKWWAALIVCNNPSFATTQPSCKTVIQLPLFWLFLRNISPMIVEVFSMAFDAKKSWVLHLVLA